MSFFNITATWNTANIAFSCLSSLPSIACSAICTAILAKTCNSLLIITFDEDDDSAKNHIPTIIYGAHVRPGEYAEYISHYSLLSTLLALYGLIPFAEAATTPPIVTIWKK